MRALPLGGVQTSGLSRSGIRMQPDAQPLHGMEAYVETGRDRGRAKGAWSMEGIIVAYDGSEAARRALERTAELANGAAVTVVSAVHVMPAVGRAVTAVDPDEVEERHRELEEAASYLGARGITPETVEVRAADVADAVVDKAKEDGADLIVVGTADKNLAQRVMLGSVSSKIVHTAPCDVLVVR